MRSRCAAVMTGPMSTPGRVPGPTRRADTFSRSFATSGSPASPTATTAEIAMQRSPAEP